MKWVAGIRKRGFRQMCIWPGFALHTAYDLVKFYEFMENELEVDVVLVGNLNDDDLAFLVRPESAARIALKRIEYGIKWAEDVVDSLPRDFIDAYPV